jgi:hypothetical protein
MVEVLPAPFGPRTTRGAVADGEIAYDDGRQRVVGHRVGGHGVAGYFEQA